jgi:hypothetical protein
MWSLHAAFLTKEIRPVVPSPVLAQVWRGSARQANLHRLMALCRVEPLSEGQARAVGILAGQSGHDDIVDVTVVEGAIRRGDAVVSSDATHLHSIAEALGLRLVVEAV